MPFPPLRALLSSPGTASGAPESNPTREEDTVTNPARDPCAARAREARVVLGDVPKELAALQQMTVSDLHQRWLELYGYPARSRHKRYLQKRLAWRIQELAYGGLSDRAQRRIDELTADAVLPGSKRRLKKAMADAGLHAVTGASRDPRIPPPGSTIRREYKGRSLEVEVLEDGGFLFEGERYGSLSAVAREITGSTWNGLLFFGLTKRSRRARKGDGR